MKTSFYALSVALLAACPVHAQVTADTEIDDPSGRDIVVTGTKTTGNFGAKSGIPLERLPQSVQVVTDDDIVEQGARSVGELLRSVPSANPGYSRVGAYQSFSLKVRGFLADQMRNGIRQRYYEDVDASALSNIERVELLKGPSGVLYGQSAVGGIVSIITKRPEDAPSASIAATLGSFDQKMLTFDATGGIAPGLTVRATGEIERSGTFVDFQDLDRELDLARLDLLADVFGAAADHQPGNENRENGEEPIICAGGSTISTRPVPIADTGIPS